MKLIYLILISIFVFGCGKNTKTIVKQGTEVQNGGYGVQVEKDKVVSLDLYLRGSHVKPYVKNNVTYLTDLEIQTIYEFFGPLVNHEAIEIVLGKLSDLRFFSNKVNRTYLVSYLIENVGNYQWIVLDNGKCTDVKDDNSPIANKVQLAYRKSNWIRFCKKFLFLDDINQAALILHEMIYASLIDKSRTLEMVGLLFHHDLYHFNRQAEAELNWILTELEANQKIRDHYLVVDDKGKNNAELEINGKLFCFSPGKAFWTNDLYAIYLKKSVCSKVEVFGQTANFMIKRNKKFYISLKSDEYPKRKDYDLAVAHIDENGLPAEICQGDFMENCDLDPITGIILVKEDILRSVKN